MPHAMVACLASDFSTRDAAAIIAAGLLANRERLVTAELTGMIALQWSVKQGEGQPWSRQGFREFLTAFVRRNFSLKRGREFAQNSKRGARTRAEAERCFEQALADLQIGPEIRVEPVNLRTQRAPNKIFQSLRRDLARSLGVIVGDMQAAAGSGGQESELDIRINDVRVPMGDGFNGQQLAIGIGQQAQQIQSSDQIECRQSYYGTLRPVHDEPPEEGSFRSYAVGTGQL